MIYGVVIFYLPTLLLPEKDNVWSGVTVFSDTSPLGGGGGGGGGGDDL